MSSGRAALFARNAVSSAGAQFLAGAANLVLLPILVNRLGHETFGLYVMLHAAASYLMLLSFGAGGATAKFVAEFHAEKNADAMRDILRLSLLVHALGALSGALLLTALAPSFASKLFEVPEQSMELAGFVLRCAAASALFAALNQVALSVLQGLQRFDWFNMIGLFQSVLLPLGAAVLLARGFGLREIAAWYLILSALVCLFSGAAAWRLLDWSGYQKKRGLPAEQFARYAGNMWLGSLSGLVTSQLDKVFVARAGSLSNLTLYAVPAGLLQRLQTLPAIVSSVLLPLFSALRAEKEPGEIERIYLRSSRMMLITLWPAFALLFALMPQFLTLWLGGDFGGRGIWPARFLVCAQAFALLCYIPNAVSAGRGYAHYVSGIAWSQAAASLLFWSWLIPRYGIAGAAAGSALAQGLPVLFYLPLIHRRVLGIGSRRFWSESLRGPLAAGFVTLGIGLAVNQWAQDWPRLLLAGAAGLATHLIAAWLLLGAGERERVAAALQGAGAAR